jgi:ribosomal protein S18 acetylase RimI-like enzyme
VCPKALPDHQTVVSDVDCNREEELPLDAVFRIHAGLSAGRPRGGWACTITLFVLEDDFVANEEVEAEVAFVTYNIGDDDLCEVVDLEVAEQFRGMGLGPRLLGEALVDMRLKGGSRVYVFAYEPGGGDRRGLFEALAFKEVVVPEGAWKATSLPFPMYLELDGG